MPFAIKGLNEAIGGQGAVLEAINDDIKSVTEQGVAQIQRGATSVLYPGHGLQTGTLKRSILFEVQEKRNSVIGIVGPVENLSGDYSRAIEYGHPRTSFRGYAYMQKGFASAKQKIENLVQQMLDFWVSKF